MKLTIPMMWSDVEGHLTTDDWRTLAEVRKRGNLSLGRAKQGLGAGVALGLVRTQVERVRTTHDKHWKRQLYRLKAA